MTLNDFAALRPVLKGGFTLDRSVGLIPCLLPRISVVCPAPGLFREPELFAGAFEKTEIGDFFDFYRPSYFRALARGIDERLARCLGNHRVLGQHPRKVVELTDTQT